MRYADSLLADGEVVIVRSRQHWLALLIDGRVGVALVSVGVLLLGLVALGPFTSTSARDLISFVALALLVIGLIVFGIHAWQWWAQDYLITNRRIVKVEGIINKRSADSSLEKINDAILEQGLWGRILGYGDLDILTAADAAVDRYRMLNQAPSFKREMINQKHLLESGYSGPPSPPLRARPFDLNGEPTREAPATREREAPATREREATTTPVSQGNRVDETPGDRSPSTVSDHSRAAAAPAPEPPLTRSADIRAAPVESTRRPAGGNADPVQITQTLARLADLRDRGAITAEEYAAKKDDLLSRL